LHKTQSFTFIFLPALFVTCILVFAPTSVAIAMDCPNGCSCFNISDGPYYVNESINFTDNSEFPQGYIREYQWNFNDSSEIDYSTNPAHVFTEPGNYTIYHQTTRNYVDYFNCSKIIEVNLKDVQTPEMTFSSDSSSLTDPISTLNQEIDTLQNTSVNNKINVPETQGTESGATETLAGSYAQANL